MRQQIGITSNVTRWARTELTNTTTSFNSAPWRPLIRRIRVRDEVLMPSPDEQRLRERVTCQQSRHLRSKIRRSLSRPVDIGHLDDYVFPICNAAIAEGTWRLLRL
jgi:hypothetical protein